MKSDRSPLKIHLICRCNCTGELECITQSVCHMDLPYCASLLPFLELLIYKNELKSLFGVYGVP